MPLSQGRRRLPVVQALPGFTGVEAGESLPLFDNGTLANVQGLNLPGSFEREIRGVAGFNTGGKHALLRVAGLDHLCDFYHFRQGRGAVGFRIARRQQQ